MRLALAESAFGCHVAAVLLFAAMPELLSMLVWRALLASGCMALLACRCLSFRQRSLPIKPAGSPDVSPPPSPGGEASSSEGVVCGSCKRRFPSEHAYRTHLGKRPPCKLAHFARLRSGRQKPAPAPPSAASEAARRSLHQGFIKSAVSDSLATLRVDKLVGGTVVGEVKEAMRDWLGLVDTELRRRLCSGQHSAKETATAISETLHVFRGLETEAQEMAYLKRPVGAGGVPYLKVRARLLGERPVIGSRKKVRWPMCAHTGGAGVFFGMPLFIYMSALYIYERPCVAERLLLRHSSQRNPRTSAPTRSAGVGAGASHPARVEPPPASLRRSHHCDCGHH